MKNQDIKLQPLNFCIEDDSEIEERINIDTEENPLTEILLKENFFKNVCDNDSYTKMISFDEEKDMIEISNILKEILKDENLVKSDIKEIIEKEVNTCFKKVIDNLSNLKKYKKKYDNMFIMVFICFSEIIDIDISLVYQLLDNSYKNILKNNLKKSIGVKKYKLYEKMSEKYKENSLDNHNDVIIRKIM